MIKGVSSAERLLKEEGSGEVGAISVGRYNIRREVAQTMYNFEQVTTSDGDDGFLMMVV